MISARPAGRACALAVATLHLACSATELEVGRTIEQYLNALQAGDRATVARLSATYHDEVRGLEGPAAQQVFERFSGWFDERWESFEGAKKTGTIELTPDGFGLIRALGLGRGGYYQVREVVEENDHAWARIEAQLGYHAVSFETFPPQTRLYLMGMPLGRLLVPVRGDGPRKLEVLASVEIVCRLEKTNDPLHPTGWLVRDFEAIPETARSIEIDWQ